MKRGDVVLVRFPHPSGQRGKKRPVRWKTCSIGMREFEVGP
jgi:hypothetical protein